MVSRIPPTPIAQALQGKAVLLCAPDGATYVEAAGVWLAELGATVFHLADPAAELPDRLLNDFGAPEAVVVAGPPAPPAALRGALDTHAWPVIGLLQRIHATFGRYPRYSIALSSMAPVTYLPGSELLAVAHSVLEVLCRYLTADLRGEDARVNAVRPGPGASPAEVAGVVAALCSGLLDGVEGQTITVDGGRGFRMHEPITQARTTQGG